MPLKCLLGKHTIGFQDQFNGLLQIGSRLFQRCSLRTGTGQFFHEPNILSGTFWKTAVSFILMRISPSLFEVLKGRPHGIAASACKRFLEPSSMHS
jgi:hypothetical protein